MIRSYVVVTPARDEAENLPRLAAALAAQTIPPTTWMIVDNGSTDGTLELAYGLAEEHDWIDVRSVPGSSVADRGAPVVRALQAGIAAVAEPPEVLVNVDADISFEPDYFERLLARFDEDPSLGIASGSAFELRGDTWEQRFVTGSTVWGASRAYRWECLQQLLPLEERVAWDGVDEFKANTRGWRTAAFEGLPFRHYRREGERDGAKWRSFRVPGVHGPLPRLPRLVSRPALTLARPPRAAGDRDDLGLRRLGAQARGAESRPRGAHLPSAPAEPAQHAAARARGCGAPREGRRSAFTARRHPARLLVGRTPAADARSADRSGGGTLTSG